MHLRCILSKGNTMTDQEIEDQINATIEDMKSKSSPSEARNMCLVHLREAIAELRGVYDESRETGVPGAFVHNADGTITTLPEEHYLSEEAHRKKVSTERREKFKEKNGFDIDDATDRHIACAYLIDQGHTIDSFINSIGKAARTMIVDGLNATECLEVGMRAGRNNDKDTIN